MKSKKLLLLAAIIVGIVLILRARGGRFYRAGMSNPPPFGTIDNNGVTDTTAYLRNRFSGVLSSLGVAGTRTPISQYPPAASTLAPTTAQAQALGYGTAPAGQQSYGTQAS